MGSDDVLILSKVQPSDRSKDSAPKQEPAIRPKPPGTVITTREIPQFNPIPDQCPFCGNPVEEPNIIGANCQLCLHCTENLGVYSPHGGGVYGHEHTFIVWSYVPPADAFPHNRAVIISLPNNEPISPAHLNEADRRLARALGYQTPTHLFPRVDRPNDDGLKERFDGLNPISLATPFEDETTRKALTNLLPRPTIFYARSACSPAVSELRSVLYRNSDDGPAAPNQTTQETLV